MSSDKDKIYVDEAAVARVDAKIKESKALTSGITSSWANPIEGLTSGPMGKITPPKAVGPEEPPSPAPAAHRQPGLVTIPAQAMKSFKALLGYVESIEVRLSLDQAKMLLESISSMPTPKKMTDARAIINLLEQLERIK